MLHLSPEQIVIPAEVSKGRNILVTGAAGTGKSTVLNALRERHGASLAVTASTGIAALNVRGTTLHTFAGLLKGEEPAEVIAARIIGARKRAFKNITQTRILAIDEISMLSGQLLDKVDQVFRAVRRNDAPFGSMQILAFGDFLQLPPVSRDPHYPASFAFESGVWSAAAIRTQMLTRVFRQADQPFVDALGRLRVGETDHPSYEMIGGRNDLDPPEDGIRAIIVHTHNADVDRINHEELDCLRGKEFEYLTNDTCKPHDVERLNRDCLAPPVLKLKEGAQVMLLANLDVANGLANGSLGVVEDLSEKSITVRFTNRMVMDIERSTWDIQNNGEIIATREQYPLRLAWAVTAHKVQGMTLDRVLCRLGRTFSPGQGYVAVSRVKTLDGLFLRDTTRNSFRAHPKAIEFYASGGERMLDTATQEEFVLT